MGSAIILERRPPQHKRFTAWLEVTTRKLLTIKLPVAHRQYSGVQTDIESIGLDAKKIEIKQSMQVCAKQ